jgi:hypothetical protein
LVDCSKWRVRPEDYQARMAERDARLAADTRTEVQKYLGDRRLLDQHWRVLAFRAAVIERPLAPIDFHAPPRL